MTRSCAALAFILWFGFGGVRDAAAQSTTVPPLEPVLLINQMSPIYPFASDIRGQQVLMLLRHFAPGSVVVADTAYRPGMGDEFDHVVVLGNDAVNPIHENVISDLQQRTRPTMWVGYGLARLFADPDRQIGFAASFVEPLAGPVEVRYRGGRYLTTLADHHRVRIAHPDVHVLASLHVAGEGIPLALRRNDFWFFGALPGLDTDYPDPSIDAPTLIFTDLLHDFLGQIEHDPRQALIRFEDVSVHIPPERLLEAVDVLARRRVPFVIGVIPAQRLEDGSILSLGDSTEFVQALRYAQDRGGTIALHGYHHTFGQGEDFEFWDPVSDEPPRGELWDTYALKVEHGIQDLRDVGVEPMLWETPHYAASPLGYRVFGSYFSHAIENRDPATWLPFSAGPDPSGQILIPENLGYINEDEGLTVDAQLARSDLLKIVRDAMAVGFYHPASVAPSHLAALADGLSRQGYHFADLRSSPLTVRYEYEPPLGTRATSALRIEPGLTLLGIQRSAIGAMPILGASDELVVASAAAGLVVGLFLIRLRAQWRPVNDAHASRVENRDVGSGRRARLVMVGVLILTIPVAARVTLLQPIPPQTVQPVAAETPVAPRPQAIESGAWEISTYFTAVEKFYSGPLETLRGCPQIDCVDGTAMLGRFPSDFIAAVKEEGSGHLTYPVGAARFLNWSIDVGYWLDVAPRDAQGSILEPYTSVAADPAIDYVTAVEVKACGVDAITKDALDLAACHSVTSTDWIVRDRFTVSEVGKHLDLYIGEQDQIDFGTRSGRLIHAIGATVVLRPYPEIP